jgi:hypothetical protein
MCKISKYVYMWTHENISKKIKYWFPFLQILINETGGFKFAIQYVKNQVNIKKME